MAIDPGGKRIGIALSDLSGTIASPYCVIAHISRKLDAQKIIQLADKKQVDMILMGVSMNDEGHLSASGRSAERLAREIKLHTTIPIVNWDEDETTNKANEVVIDLGISKQKRKGHHDDLAAAILLQSYIEYSKYSQS